MIMFVCDLADFFNMDLRGCLTDLVQYSIIILMKSAIYGLGCVNVIIYTNKNILINAVYMPCNSI